MKSRKIKIVNKYRFVFSITVMLLIAFFLLSMFFDSFKVVGEEKSNYATIEVKAGDTVWDIAANINREVFNYKKDIRMISYGISEENNLDNYFIYPGQELVIPLN